MQTSGQITRGVPGKVAFTFGCSLFWAFLFGPLAVLPFERREFRLLPISRRQLWRG